MYSQLMPASFARALHNAVLPVPAGPYLRAGLADWRGAAAGIEPVYASGFHQSSDKGGIPVPDD